MFGAWPDQGSAWKVAEEKTANLSGTWHTYTWFEGPDVMVRLMEFNLLLPLWTVAIDGIERQIENASLAGVANAIRGTGKHFRVWSPQGVLMIDTEFGDIYGLI